MVNVVATGVDALAIERAAHLFALSPTLQNGRTWQRTHDDSVFYGSKPTCDEEQRPERPYVVVDFGDETRWQQIAGGGFNLLRPAGGVHFVIEYDWPDDYKAGLPTDEMNARHEAFSFMGNIVGEVIDRAGADVSGELGKEFDDESGDFNFHNLRYTRAQTDTDEYAQEDWFFRVVGVIEWGDNAL